MIKNSDILDPWQGGILLGNWVGPKSVEHLHEHRSRFMAIGIFFIVLGTISCLAVGVATLASVVLMGWLLAIGGVSEVVHAFYVHRWSGFLLHILGGILYAVAGLYLIFRPFEGAASLTLLMAAFFLVAGVTRVVTAAALRFPGWGWVMASGVLAAFLSVLIIRQWPVSSIWVIGTFVGIDLIFNGWSLVMFSRALEDFAPRRASEL